MAQKKQDLFLWNRRTGQSDTKHGKKKNSIQDWIKRVQDASDDATQEVLGGDLLGTDSLKEIIPDDEALYEAQELLDGWMKETSFPNLHRELDYKGESWSSSTGLVLNDEPNFNLDYNDNTTLSGLTKKYLGDDINSTDYGITTSHKEVDLSDHLYSLCNDDDEDIDDALLVQDVLHGMLSKDFTKNVDLGMKPLEKTAKNPVPRMNIRHEQVKVRGEKRRQKNIIKKKEKLTQEEIAQKARERVVLEERQRIQLKNVEEKAIMSEMEKIKRELAEEKQRREEEAQRKRKILDEAKLQMQIELRKQKEEETRKKKEKEEARWKIQKEIDEEVVHELRLNMKILHKYFSAWYNVVLETRIGLGKAQAIADWKCKVRAWNAWKAYISCVKYNQQAKEIEQAMKEKYRKEQMSITHNNNKLMRKCFSSWCRYTHYNVEKKMLLLEHEEKAKKMALFLEAASKGDLWGKKPAAKVKKDTEDEFDSGAILEEREDAFNVDSKKKSVIEKSIETKKLQNVTSIHSNEAPKHSSLSRVKDKLVTTKVGTKKSEGREQANEKKSKYIVQAEPIGATSIGGKSHDICKEEEGNALTPNSVSNLNGNAINGNASERSAHLESGNKVLTDRSDVSSISSLVSRKPQIRSDKQITKPLHLAMEERQKERNKRKAAMEEERKKREEERLEVLRAKEAERLRQEQVEKEERMRQKQEEKKLEALKLKEKEFQVQQLRLKNQIAKGHYEKVLLRKYGLEPLTRLVQVARLNIQIGDKYHNSLLARVCFMEWHVYVKELSCERRDKADKCYDRILMKRAFRSWLKCRFHLQNMNKIARNFSLTLVVKRAFNAWQEYVTDERILMWAKESTAEEHDTTRMLTKCLRAWVTYVKVEKEEREREYRKDEWRKKVQSWLPDYKGGTEMT